MIGVSLDHVNNYLKNALYTASYSRFNPWKIKEKDIILYIWVLKENESSILFWFQVLYYIHFHVKELALIIACLKELTTKYWDKKHILKRLQSQNKSKLVLKFFSTARREKYLHFLKGSGLHKATFNECCQMKKTWYVQLKLFIWLAGHHALYGVLQFRRWYNRFNSHRPVVGKSTK